MKLQANAQLLPYVEDTICNHKLSSRLWCASIEHEAGTKIARLESSVPDS
jgi:hypothetical protein